MPSSPATVRIQVRDPFSTRAPQEMALRDYLERTIATREFGVDDEGSQALRLMRSIEALAIMTERLVAAGVLSLEDVNAMLPHATETIEAVSVLPPTDPDRHHGPTAPGV
jgi:hypothetical protein